MENVSNERFQPQNRAYVGRCTCRVAFRRPTLPKETGRDAFAKDHDGRGPLTVSSRLLWMSESKDWVASLIKVDGQVRREKEILGKPTQGLSNVVSSCESCRSGRAWLSFPTLLLVKELQEGWPMADPRTNPSLVVG